MKNEELEQQRQQQHQHCHCEKSMSLEDTNFNHFVLRKGEIQVEINP
jgi:hypothetical protein